jgi:acyl-CoA thioester hydrolase
MLDTPMNAPFSKATAIVQPAWIDYNGHMNVGYYHVAFDIASEPFFEWLGLTPEFRKLHASSTFALQSQLHFLREVKEGDKLRFESRLIDADSKRIRYYQEMFHADEGYLAATYESMSVHMDMKQRRSAAMPDALYQRMQEVLRAHKKLAEPWQVGHVFGAKPPH